MSSNPYPGAADDAPLTDAPPADAAPPADGPACEIPVDDVPARAPATGRQRAVLAVYVAAVFTSAFLLFLVQPLFGKMVLPLLGGTPAVWNTCMLFFQAALLGGYLYAHLSTRLDPRRQALLHLALLAAAALALPLSLGGAAPEGGRDPIPWLLAVMLTSVGIPFLVLSGTGPMLQRWFAHTGHPTAADPYHLYAASNVGSMLALLAYPFFVEPRLRLMEQSAAWSLGYGALVLLIAGCGAAVWRAAPAAPVAAAAPDDAAPLPVKERARWTLLAFVPSSLLLGVTTHITIDLAPVPLLWVLPLALYLLTFTLVFARRQLIPHGALVRFQPALLLAIFFLLQVRFVGEPQFAVPVHLAGLFVTAMVCHGELARRRPPVRHLTEFYLWISVGGVLGGVFNVLLAPVLFSRHLEYPLVIILACLARPWPDRPLNRREVVTLGVRMVTLTVALGLLMRPNVGGLSPWLYVPVGALVMGTLSYSLGRRPLWLAACFASLFVAVEAKRDPGMLLSARSFFGSYQVRQVVTTESLYHTLHHGSTLHGAQNLRSANRRDPLTYYVGNGPLGHVFAVKAAAGTLRSVAVVGLGTGTTAAYARPGERWTFYEIDPGIARIARDTAYFTYLADSPAATRIVYGDARLSLAQESGPRYDLIVLDAFSSDAIPIHLLTREALQIYLSRLAPGGVIAIHISNRYLDLASVVRALADDARLAARIGTGPATRPGRYDMYSEWVVVARSEADLASIVRDPGWKPLTAGRASRPWTDDYSSILDVFEW